MAKFITMQQVNLIVDLLYHNCQRVSYEQKSMKQIAKDAGVGIVVATKIRDLLVSMKLVVKTGERRNQRISWHPDKCAPNPAMLTNIYREYTKDAKCRVKVNVEKSSKKISLESALQTLVRLGYTGVISKTELRGFVSVTESIDLSKIECGE